MCYFRASSVTVSIVMAVLALAGSVACVQFAPAAIAATGKDDPREVVVDELAGQAVTFLVCPFLVLGSASNVQILSVTAVGLVLFRVFDVAKPWPICKFERLPKGWGILADDLAAGVCAWVVLQVCTRLLLVG